MTAQVFDSMRLLEPEHAATAVAQHREIARAIAEGDSENAEQLARVHIRSTTARLRKKGNA